MGGRYKRILKMYRTIRYWIDFREADRHLAQIRLEIPKLDLPFLELVFPVWTPGSYMLREYTRNIETISAFGCNQLDTTSTELHFDDDRKEIVLRRDGKNRWFLEEAMTHDWLIVEYQLYCRENSVRTNWIDSDYGFITGAATFPYIDNHRDKPIQIKLIPQCTWKEAASPLTREIGTISADSRPIINYLANSYDELVDSPIVLGNFESRSFEAGGRQHHLINVGGGEFWDLDRAIADMEKIVVEQHRFWSDIPYEQYWFINLCAQSYGGLEHDNSTVLMCNRLAMLSRESYVNWLSLVSHEFFHTWNVRRLRPRTLMNYNYESEQFFRELWIAEGITSYYDDLLLFRSGGCSEEEYLKRLSDTIRSVQNSPGRLVQSLADSSWDAWVKHYRPDENSQNSRISYYLKGSLVAWLLDARLQAATHSRVSLQSVVQKLWQEYHDLGYTLHDFGDLVEQLGSLEIRQWLDATIDSASDLDFQPALDHFGLKFRSDQETIDPLCVTLNAVVPDTSAWLGLETAWTEGRLIVRRVIRNSSADRAGINVDDELIAINDNRLNIESWPKIIVPLAEGRPCEIIVSRREKLRRLAFTIPSSATQSWRLEKDKDSGSST